MEFRWGGGGGGGVIFIMVKGQLSVGWLCIMLAMQKRLAPAHSIGCVARSVRRWLFCGYKVFPKQEDKGL